MRLRLKESQEEKLQYDKESKELISNISHDLKTPITAIKGYVEGIQDGVASSPEKLNKYIRTIYNKANDMDRLIDELTFYSKIDTNKIRTTFQRSMWRNILVIVLRKLVWIWRRAASSWDISTMWTRMGRDRGRGADEASDQQHYRKFAQISGQEKGYFKYPHQG